MPIDSVGGARRFCALARLEARWPRPLSHRKIDLRVKGTDATLYLGMLRDSILTTLETMPRLPFKEEVELRSDMRMTAVGPGRPDSSIWMPYEIILTAQRSGVPSIVGPDGIYAMDRVLAAMPVRSDFARLAH
jgi:hypothetical protein